jgi:hypothetical protein
LLQPLPPLLHGLLFNEDFSKKSIVYNNVLALSAVGVENEAGGGWDQIHGNHAMQLHGRTYHKFHNSRASGGIQYFLHSNEEEMIGHGNMWSLNEEILKGIYDMLLVTNPLCIECHQIGSLSDCLDFAGLDISFKYSCHV